MVLHPNSIKIQIAINFDKIVESQFERCYMIYFRGCVARDKLHISETIEKLLKKAEINYKLLDEEGCCGSVLLRTGFVEDALQVMKDTFKDIKDETVLVSCAGCYKTFKEDYPEFLGGEINVVHTSQLFARLVDEGKLKLVNDNKKVTYHDPCHLGRHMGEYEAPRSVISKAATLVEMEKNKDNSKCCGSGGGVRSAFPEISEEIARERIADARLTGAEEIITCCPFCILNLTSAQEQGKSENCELDHLEVVDLGEFILKRLRHE